MNTIKIKNLVLLLIFYSVISCQKEIIYTGIPGQLKGRVRDNNGNNLGNVKVTITGTPSPLVIYSNEEGIFSFDDLKTGIYNLEFAKDSFGTFRINSFQFLGGNIPSWINPVVLYKPPSTIISDVKVELDTNYIYSDIISPIITGKLKIDANSSYIFARYFLSDQPDVSATNYKISDEKILRIVQADSTFRDNITININKGLYNEGNTIYIVFYPSVTFSYNTYQDIETGNLIYTNISNQGSNIASFKIPYIKNRY
ncbi:MAG: carboxypeptidase-like regulatory domain-containing protein [Bacteroidales bacterium]